MGNYHHHQNPSAFKLDKNVISTVCNLYDADGLYVIDTAQHSPLLGFAYDGYPIYGAYGYKNTDGSGGITRIKSGYQLRNISARTVHADGTDVPDGPAVNTTYPLGYFREDYEFIAHPSDPDYLDVHNGRFCITPEYPNGTYAYFCTVDANHNSAYPYAVGPTFYGVYANRKVGSVSEATTVYTPAASGVAGAALNDAAVTVFPNPTADIIAIQVSGLVAETLPIALYNLEGRWLAGSRLLAGQTISYLDAQPLYNGTYVVAIGQGATAITRQVVISRP